MAVRIVKHAPCGLCKGIFERDALASMNVHFYDANDDVEKIKVRACPTCINESRQRFLDAAWDNASMTRVEVEDAAHAIA